MSFNALSAAHTTENAVVPSRHISYIIFENQDFHTTLPLIKRLHQHPYSLPAATTSASLTQEHFFLTPTLNAPSASVTQT